MQETRIFMCTFEKMHISGTKTGKNPIISEVQGILSKTSECFYFQKYEI